MPKQTPPESDIPPATDHAGARFFRWIRSLGLVRQPGWIGGVSAGIADRIGIDVVIVRGILVVIALLGGPAVLLYAAAWLLLPDTDNRIHLEDLLRGKVDSPVIGIAVLVTLALLPVSQGFWWFGSVYWGQPSVGESVARGIWTIVLLGLLVGVVIWLSQRAKPVPGDSSAPPPPPGAGASADAVTDWRKSQAEWRSQHETFRQQQAADYQRTSEAAVSAARTERIARALEYRERRARTRSNPVYTTALIGIALVAGAATTLALGNGGLEPLNVLTGLAIAVGVLGLGIVINGAIGRRSGGASDFAVLLLLPLIAAAIFPQSDTVRYQGAIDHRLHYSSQSLERYFYQVSGNVTLDLGHYFPTTKPAAHNRIELWVGSGNVTVIVPVNEYVDLSARTLAGVITTPSGSRHHPDWSGVTRASTVANLRPLDVGVYVASGNVTFVSAKASNGATK
jgi:phage shock protein PspC (stress-responsive transcriptional regulator)